MFASSPQQQPEPRPVTPAGYVRLVYRKVREALRPVNPFRTATGVAVTGEAGGEPARQAPSDQPHRPRTSVPVSAVPGGRQMGL